MERKYDVFISYRREGGDKYARNIQLELEKKYHVFLDFDELKDGVFDKRITDAIREAPIFLLVLSRGALDRCVNEDDWVRKEILYAAECNSHIVPVVIVDDAFEGIPSDLPEELKRLVGSHQFSELQMQTLFKPSMDKLISDRIAPFVLQQEKQSGAEIHIETDAPCRMFCFKTFVKDLKPGIDNIVRLNPGTYKISFVSTQYPSIEVTQKYTLATGVFADYIEIMLKEKVEERIRDEQEKQPLFPIKRNWKYGYEDYAGKIVIPCQWEDAYNFHEGLAIVADDRELYGVIDKTGKVVSPCQWVSAEQFSEGLAKVKDKNDKWGYIDKKGDLAIPCHWKECSDFHEGLACVKNDSNKWGYIDYTGNVVIQCKWDTSGIFSDGLAVVIDYTGIEGYIDKTGRIVIPSEWTVLLDFHEGLANVGFDKYINKSGKVVFENSEWDFGFGFSEGLARIRNKEGKYGYINRSGNTVVPFCFLEASDFHDGLACVTDNNYKKGFIDKSGSVAIACQWEGASDFFNGHARVYTDRSHEKWRYINTKGEYVDLNEHLSQTAFMKEEMEDKLRDKRKELYDMLNKLPNLRDSLTKK